MDFYRESRCSCSTFNHGAGRTTCRSHRTPFLRDGIPMSMKHLFLLMPLLLGACSTTPSRGSDIAEPLAGQAPDEGRFGGSVASDGDEGKGDEKPAAKHPKGAQVAFHVAGMKKTKSGAT